MPRKDIPSDSGVRLSPILGVRPGIYLTALYGIVLVLVLFFIFFFPGLKNRGSYVYFEIQPGKASVIVDGTFAGTAPGSIFLKHGKRHVEISKAFYSTEVADIDIQGRVFATLILPSRQRVAFRLTVSDPTGLIAHSFEDFTSNQFIPQIISETAKALYTVGKVADRIEFQQKLYNFVFNCMYYINPLLDSSMVSTSSENQIGEIVKASLLATSSGSFITPSSLITLVRNTIQVKDVYYNSPGLVLLSLSREKSKKLSDTQWIIQHFTNYRNTMLTYYQVISISENRDVGARPVSVIGGIPFRSIPKGVLIMGKDDNLETLGKNIDLLLPHPVSIKPYYLSETEVTNLQYQSFVDTVPRWRPSNRDALVKENLTTEEYLSDWINDRFPSGRADYPVTSISYDAARAFCGWFSQKSQSVMPGYTAQLPTEAEWEWAARGGLRGMPYPLGEKPGNAVLFSKGIAGPSQAGTSSPNAYGLRDMVGNVWEWCEDSFGSADYLLTSLDPEKNAELMLQHPESVDKVVRGGAWNNQKESVKVYTRGSQPKQWCTPFLGFRVVLAAR
jgi:formylglycine-generating enzyme required for sulfatase activity